MNKKFLYLFSAIIFLLFLSGCQKKCPKASENIPGTEGYRSDCPYEPEEEASSGHKELDFYFVHDNTDVFQEQIQAFQSQNPGFIVRTKKFADLNEYEDLIINEIAEGEGPDVFMIHNSWMLKHWKKLLPMPMNLPIVITPDMFRSTFFAAAADDLIVDEKVYGMPIALDNLALYYNKAYFRDLIATTDMPGRLWENIKEQVFQLTKRNNSPERFALTGIGMGRADNVARALDILYTLFLQYEVNMYDIKGEQAEFATEAGAGSAGLKNPGLEAFTFYTSFGLPSFKNYSWNEYITGYAPDEKEINPFVRGKTAMIFGYPYLYDQLALAIQNQQKAGGDHINTDDIGIAPMPQLVSPTEATKRDTLASYYPLVVARTTDIPKEAWMFAQYLASADSQQTYYKKTHHPTSRKDLVQEQQTDPVFGVFAFQAPFAKSIKIFDSDAYAKIFTEAIQNVVENVSTPKEALTEAQEKITCVIKKQRGLISYDEACL